MTDIIGETSIDIHASPQTVYDYLVDFTRHPEWVLNVSKVEKLTAGLVGVGTKFKAAESAPPAPLLQRLKSMVYFVKGMIQGANSYSEAEITGLERGKRIAWTGRIARREGNFNRSDWEFVIEPQNGGTRLVQRFHYSPQTEAAQKMLAALGEERGLAEAVGRSLVRLKHRLETSSQN